MDVNVVTYQVELAQGQQVVIKTTCTLMHVLCSIHNTCIRVGCVAQWLERRSLTMRTYTGLRSICSGCVTTYVGIMSAIGQPTRPTQPFILPESINE